MSRVEEDRLRAIVRGSRWFLGVLEAVRESALPDAWVGAGALRDLVWGTLHDGFEVTRVRDVDVAYFDAADLRRERDDEADTLLRSLRPDVPWEAKNQAAVHTWY
ncbi:MAG: nucleotidyltransferase family protein, partial [Candidatus Dormiibacterota bacterium]